MTQITHKQGFPAKWSRVPGARDAGARRTGCGCQAGAVRASFITKDFQKLENL